MKKRKIPLLALGIITGLVLLMNIAMVKGSERALFDPTKEHHETDRFRSKSGATFPEWLMMRFKEGSVPPVTEEEAASIVRQPDLELVNSPSDTPRATWVGHATMLVQYRGVNFLTDPHLTDYPAPIDLFAPKRLTPPALSFARMPKIDFIVISHSHYDHLDHRTVKMFGNAATWYVPLGLKFWFIDQGIESDNVIELDWWQSHQFSPEVTITLTPAAHWSKRVPWDTNKSLWGSWSVRVGDFNSWFGGDTAYDEEMFKEIGEKAGPFDLAFIPIGAYGPRYFMAKQHVDPAQAILVHKDIRATRSIPIHWGTFQLTHEPFFEPPELLVESAKKEGLPREEFSPVKVGETLVLNKIVS